MFLGIKVGALEQIGFWEVKERKGVLFVEEVEARKEA